MKTQETIDFGALAGLALAAVLAVLNAANAQLPSSGAIVQRGQTTACTSCTIVREIDDPHSGQHWILMRDPAHLGGPGVLMAEESVPNSGWLAGGIARLHPVIRAGDRLTVEESSAKAYLRLEGIALSPAAPGAQLHVRLALSGKVVEALAVGPGRAVRIPEREFWP